MSEEQTTTHENAEKKEQKNPEEDLVCGMTKDALIRCLGVACGILAFVIIMMACAGSAEHASNRNLQNASMASANANAQMAQKVSALEQELDNNNAVAQNLNQMGKGLKEVGDALKNAETEQPVQATPCQPEKAANEIVIRIPEGELEKTAKAVSTMWRKIFESMSAQRKQSTPPVSFAIYDRIQMELRALRNDVNMLMNQKKAMTPPPPPPFAPDTVISEIKDLRGDIEALAKTIKESAEIAKNRPTPTVQ